MRFRSFFVTLVALCVLAGAQTQAASLLVVSGQGLPFVRYGGSDWDSMTSLIDSTFTMIDTMPVIDTSTDLSSYDAVWLDQRLSGPSSTISSVGAGKLTAFAAGSGRIVMIGENANWNTWNNSMLDIVGGGTLGGQTWGPASAVTSHFLTQNVSQIFVGGGGEIASGTRTNLFDQDVAALWGNNVVTIMDTNIFSDADTLGGGLSTLDNLQFATNLVQWSANVPEPGTGLMLGMGISILSARRRAGLKRKAA